MFPLKDDNPSNSAPVVTVALIVLNALFFVYQISLEAGGADGARAGQAFIDEFGLVPCRLTGACRVGPELPSPILTIFTSMFMHGGLFHIGGNMLYLWIFGNNVEDTLGHGRYLLFYLLSGVAAALAQTAVGPSSMVPMVGASGAVSGVLGAYLLLFPHAHVTTLIILGFFFRLVHIPAMVVLGFWIVLQVLNGLGSFGSSGGVAFFAHIGGFLFGMGLLYVLKPRARSRAG
ncbi:MAG TPA: rhomboid family intramembrane serine protease [Candidatus Dormibacteraeota bacterium]|nr:rhomboid family intramembrane serine protease [Methylomirabilota bacterium]HWN01866.1 rhomboid family intramembrane serine protease [Candidatus Dormibacteraeota bacterium]